MKNKKLWIVIFLIIVIGCFTTTLTKHHHALIMSDSVDMTVMEESDNTYISRLEELDEKISENNSETAGTTNLLKSAAEQEHELWEQEMQRILSILDEKLPDSEKEELIRGQKLWMRSRESAALEASGKQRGSSLEEVEYILSYSESTRSRTYELAEEYAVVLAEAE